jgi:hypothetical protein
MLIICKMKGGGVDKLSAYLICFGVHSTFRS